MNCHQCKYPESVPGDCHIKCNHPAVENEIIVGLQSLLAAKRVDDAIVFDETGIQVVADAHGVKKGWCFWPLLFDPVWIRSCTGFTPRTPTQ